MTEIGEVTRRSAVAVAAGEMLVDFSLCHLEGSLPGVGVQIVWDSSAPQCTWGLGRATLPGCSSHRLAAYRRDSSPYGLSLFRDSSYLAEQVLLGDKRTWIPLSLSDHLFLS